VLRIQATQLDVFTGAVLTRFEDDMLAHVARYFPAHHRILGEPQVRTVIRHAGERARAHGFDTERNLCLYLTLTLMLGSHFDVDVLLPWAAVMLDDPAVPIATLRIDHFTNEAMAYLDRLAGPKNRHLEQVFPALREALAEILDDPGHAADAGADPRCARHLQRIFPHKYEAVGEENVSRLIVAATASARRYGLTTWRDTMIYVVCAFLMGSSFDRDPQFPWADEALTDRHAPDGEARATRLLERGLAWVDAWLAPAEARHV
jgi:hypothetical protein